MTRMLPSRALARLCQVDEKTVREMRKEIGMDPPPEMQKYVNNKAKKVNARSAGGKKGKRAK